MIQVNRIYLIFNRLVTKKFLVDTSETTCLHDGIDPFYLRGGQSDVFERKGLFMVGER